MSDIDYGKQVSNHVPKKETCQALKEAGLDIDTEFYWVSNGNDRWSVDTDSRMWSPYSFGNYYDEYIPAPLLSELYEVMYTGSHDTFRLFKSKKGVWVCHLGWTHMDSNITFSDEDNAVEPLCKMLIWLAENNKINNENV